jgi:hypothetical protein
LALAKGLQGYRFGAPIVIAILGFVVILGNLGYNVWLEIVADPGMPPAHKATYPYRY